MLRLVAHARRLAIGSVFAIASLGIVNPIPAAAADPPAPSHWGITVGGGDNRTFELNRFYPNNITVHPGDVVSFNWMGGHTVTFNPPPTFSVFDVFNGPNGVTTLSSGTNFILGLPSFTSFPPPSFDLSIASTLPNGKYKFQCTFHQFMHGEINVTRGALPATNADYQALGQTQAAADLARAISLDQRTTRDAAEKSGEAVVGLGNKVADFVKFYPSAITVNVGDELTFTSRDLHEPHTVTFGPVPGNQFDPTTGVFPSGPGNPNAFNGTSALNSGFLFAKSQYDYWNLKASPVAAAVPRTEFSVTFTTPGTYNFYCAVHGRLLPDGSVVGMSGHITVLPAESG